MGAIDSVVESWRASGVPLNGPASEDEFARLAVLFDGTLPPEVRRFYSLANGMSEHDTDGWFLCFWSIDQILREQNVVFEGTVRWIGFADFLIHSHLLRMARVGSGVVVFVDDGGSERYSSLEAFFESYLADPSTFGLPETEF